QRRPLAANQPKPNRAETRRRNLMFLQQASGGGNESSAEAGENTGIGHSRQKKMGCPKCDFGFYKIATLIDHLKKAHNTT
ncbi:hypothetical protein PFISCL1PPCAC_11079, partial [Pristionchus fissidentatus]